MEENNTTIETQKWLYDKLTSKNINLGSFEQFSENLNDNQTREWVYNKATQSGLNLGTYDDFNNNIISVKPASQTTNTDTTVAVANPVEEVKQDYTPKYTSLTKNVEEIDLLPEQESEYATGFGQGFKQGAKGLGHGIQHLGGEFLNLFTGSTIDEEKALERIAELERNGIDIESAIAPLDKAQKMFYETAINQDGEIKLQGLTDEDIAYAQTALEKDAINKTIRKYIEKAGGLEEAKIMLAERANEETTGDKLIKQATEGLAKLKPTKGFGAWVGNLAPQMIPAAVSIGVGAVTKNPKLTQGIGMAGMSAMTVSTAGMSMNEAREAGATGLQTWAVGIADGAIEFATEKIPFNRYTSRVLSGVKKKVGSDLSEAITNSPQARNELERLLQEANKRLGGKLFNGKNVKDFAGDIVAEGLSEFTAEALQTITPMIYENPEDYPTIGEILRNGWEGAKAGIFMGSVLGGASKTMEHYQHRNRRKEQGFVDVVEFESEDGNIIGELVGMKDDKLVVLSDGKTHEVTPENIIYEHQFNFEEFDRAELQMENEESFDNGYSLSEQQEMNDAKNMYDYQRALIEELVDGNMLDKIDNDPLSTLHTINHNENWTREEKDIVLDYLNAKATYDGMIQRVRDDIDGKIEESNSLIDSHTNKRTGMIHGAVSKENGKLVYIVSGNVVAYDDGTGIDLQKSDESIIIRDAETGELQQVSPEFLSSLYDAQNPNEQKEINAQQIREKIATEESNKIDGVVDFNDKTQFLNNVANQIAITMILAQRGLDADYIKTFLNNAQIVENPDGTLTFTDGQNKVIVPKQEIQQQVDTNNKQRAVDFNETVKQTRNAITQQDKNTTETTEYSVGDNVVLIDSEGNKIDGTISMIEDGTYIIDYNDNNGSWHTLDLTQQELDNMTVERNGVGIKQPVTEHELVTNNSTEEKVSTTSPDLIEKNVSLQTQEQQDEVSQRISQNNDRTQASQNERMEEAAIRLRSSSEALFRDSGKSQSEISESEVKEAESYAKENGIWIPFNDVFNLGRPGKSGNENDTYFSPEGYVYKVNNLINSGDIASLLERLLLHNQVFPETAYELVGFTGFEGRNVYPIVKQNAVNNPTEATTEEIEAYMTSLGFTKISETGYTNNEIVVSDLHPRNVLKDADGDIYVVDAEFKKTSQSLIPKDESGNPIYEQANPSTAWDALLELTKGNEARANTLVQSTLEEKESELKKLSEKKIKFKTGLSMAEKNAILEEQENEVEKIKQDIEAWKKIAAVPMQRQIAQQERIRQEEAEAAAKRKAEEERLMAERQKMDLTEREKLDGTPDIIDDIPNNARLRGYRRVNGHLVERQQPIQAIQGKETDVEFSNDVRPKGHYAVIDASQLQPSHIQGNRNPLHFLDEAQPKERNDEASIVSAQKIAGNIRPATITTGETAYVGTPTINTRGEVIQGNSRSDALRLMWNNHQEQGQKYKQHLIDNAEQFGLNPEDVSNMESPVLVRMLDVSDEQAITLGQYVAQDTESGGVERIKPKNAVKKMGDDINSFANMLLDSADEDTSFAELLDQNGVKVLKWMAQKGYITDTQYSSAFDTKGSLTAEAKNDLRGIMYQSIFEGGNTRLEEMFNALPAKAQKAILATAHRDFNSPNSERMIEEIQNSIRAFYALMQDEQFAKAKNFKDATKAVEAWQKQYQMDDVTGEGYLPSEKFSNFALHLAKMYKGEKQSNIQGVFAELYDLIQGTKEDNLFEQADKTPRTLVQAIKEVLNIDYNGQRRNNVLGGDNKTSQQGQHGRTGDVASRERTESGEQSANDSGRTDEDSGSPTFEIYRQAENESGDIRTAQTVHQSRSERKRPEQTPDGRRKTDGSGVADDNASIVEKRTSRSDIRVLEEGLDAERGDNTEHSERTRRTAESERLVNTAKQHGLFIPAEVIKTLTGKYLKRTGESVVFIDTEAGKVTKVKDPYAKSALKNGVQPEDAIFEHRVHNLLFPETAYTLEGISEELGDVRIVLTQNYIQTKGHPTKEQIAEALAKRGLFPEDNYSFGNEFVSVTDVEGDNVLLGEDGTVYFIDPIIRFKKPLREILSDLGNAEHKTSIIDEQIQTNKAETSTTPIQGYSYDEIIETVKDVITDIISDNEIEGVDIKEIWAHGSRMRGDSKSDSDLDIVMFYEGDAREDDLFNLISESNLAIEGIKIDVNPIRVSSHKDIEAYKKKSKQYDEEKKASTIGERILAAEKEVNTSPTDKQKEAGNYKKGHVQIGTFNVTIEQPKDSVRSGVDANGKKWETTMHNTYGYIRGTEGVDGDHIDVFLSNDIDGWNGNKIFVVDQYNEDGTFDEHKVMLGFNDIEEAESAYLDNYEKGWEKKHKIVVSPIHTEEFEKWINSSHRKTKAFAEYKSVQVSEKRTNDSEKRQQLYKFNVGDIVLDYYNKKLYRIKKHSPNGVSTIAKLDEEGNEVSTTQINAHNNARYSLAEAPVKVETPTISQESEQVSDQDNAPYTINPTQYTTKKGKVLDMHLVKFAGTLTKEQQRAAKELAKAEKGWYDREQGGFMMRSEESAKQLAETILNNDDAVSDAQPVSLADTRKIVETEQQVQPTNPSGNRLVTDERYAELRERMRKKLGGQMNIGIDPEILAIGTEMAVYHLEKGARKFTEYAKAMIADLGDVIRPYLKAFYNGARELPEVVENSLASDMTSYDEVQTFDVANFDKGSANAIATAETIVREVEVEKEVEIAKDRIKNARNAGKEDNAVTSLDKTAVYNKICETANIDLNGVNGKIMDITDNVVSTISEAMNIPNIWNKPDSIRKLRGDIGTVLRFSGITELKQNDKAIIDEVLKLAQNNNSTGKIKNPKKKSVISQSQTNMFDDLFDNENTNDNGLQGIYEVRSERLSTDSDRDSGTGSKTGNSQEVQQESRRTDGGRVGGSGRTGNEVQHGDKRSSGRLQGITEKKNTRNNRSERGKDHAPASVNARIEANIKAIELAKQLLENGEQASKEQMEVLRKFSGWGGLGKAFNERSTYTHEGRYHYNEPTIENKKIRELIGEEAYQQAVMSANSAYYTPAYVVDTLWDIAEQMGFKGGNILEGSAGIGNILGQMPAHISENSDIHAIEIDYTSGAILSLLYPDAKVEIQGFEETRIANGSVDLAITNVPFVTGLRVNDTTGDKDLSKKFHNIHDFCIAKNVRKLREGGLGIFITSNGTLDNSKKLRDWIVSEGNSDFVGAFRMHNKTFGGTSVTSDIIVIRKRINGQKSANAIDVSTVSGERVADYNTGETRKVKGVETPVVKQLSMDYNQYFIEHPEMMSGKMHFAFEKGDTFRPTSKGLYPSQDKNQEQMLAEFVQSFTAEEFGERTTDDATGFAEAMQGKKLGELFVKDGKLYTYTLQGAKPLEVNANKVKGHTKVECFEAYTAIKEALAEVLEYQTKHENDNGLNPLMTKLNKAYDEFVKTYGHFNKNTAIAFLRNDVDYANIASIETYKEIGDGKGGVKQTFGKADVMKKRVIEKEKEPTPTNVKDGIIASIFKFGRVDVPYIAEQLGVGIEDVKKEIIESGYGFENPATRQIEASYQYLSGNVREKLRQAKENNENGAFDRNIKALQEVIPMDIPAHLIDFTLGSSWVEPELYNEYVKDRTDVDVKFTAVGGTWFMKEPYFTNYEKNRSMGVTSEMLGKTIMGHTLIEAAIQNKSITVSTIRKNWDGTTETIVDKEATQACASKIDEIRQDFKEWARQKMQSDPEMSAKMERIYNDTFNNYVPMKVTEEFLPKYFIGAIHKYEMRPHQKRAIVRGTMQPLMLAHEVGSGKTFTLISTAMEMRRLGTARKPMIVVQNATVGQFVANAKELYPNAKILTLEDSDRNAEGRKNFYAKIKYNDWDMIIIPQSTFEFIPDSEEREMAFVQDKIEEKMLILEQMKEADPDGNSIITRQAEREIALLEEELAELSETASMRRTARDEKKRAVALQNAEVKAMEMLDRRTDDVENFDDMGIDALLIDEAHEYKHLGFATAMQRGVKGVDPSYSKKSQGVFLKTQAVLEKNNGRNVIFATGTPISNTAAEIWTFMRYLMPADTMKEYGIYYFDDFVRNFGNIQQMLEFTTSGKFKENNRFAGYVNLPELVRIWSGVSDTVNFEDIEEDLKKQGKGDLRPEIETGKAQDIYLPQTRALRSIMKFVKAQLEKYDQMSGKQKKENSHIPLTMYGIAKAAAVDARLVEKDAEDDPNSKTNEAVRQTLRSLKETENYKGTVAIFADNYQNKHTGFNLYEDIRTKLIAEGVNENEIVVIKSGMTVKKKLEIFEKVNRGEIRVILGSTFTLGTGVNIQERLHTLIHLDAPNRPMDYTQRNGRIQRQGNIHKDMGIPVRILRFGVEDSLDVTAYQRLKTKGAIADSIMKGKQMMSDSMSNRVLEEEEDVFGDTVAQLSGSEYAMLKNNAEKNVRKYESRKKQWEADQTYIHNAKPRIKGLIKDAETRIELNSRNLKEVQSAFPDGKFKEITIGKKRFTSIEAMEDFFKEYNKNIIADTKKIKDGEMSGNQTRELTIQIGDYSFIVKTELTKEYSGKGMNLFAEVHRKMTYSCPQLGIEDAPVRQALLRNGVEDIVGNVITGKDFAERLESAERSKDHNESELEQLISREGKPFEYEKELEQAKKQFIEYSELMKKEMAEKEAKYAEMDASVESATDISNTEEEDDVLYREEEYKTEKIFGGIWIEDKQEFAKFVSAVNNNYVFEEDGEGITYTDNHFYAYYWNIDGEPIPYIDVYLNAEESQDVVNEVSKEINHVRRGKGIKKYIDRAITRAGSSNGKNNGNHGNNTSIPHRAGNDKLGGNILRKGRYFDNPSLYVKTQRADRYNREGINSTLSSSPIRAQRKQMIEHVEDLAKRLHLDNIEIVNSVSGLEGKKKGAKGFFSKKSGKITIVVPNHTSIADIEKTLLHEAVAHYGLRKLFGKHFDTFLDNVYNNVEESIRKHIAELAIKKYNYDFRKATEEYLASLAERTNFENIQQSSWWQKIKDFFADMLSKLGFKDFRGVTLTDNELRYILWRSYENLSSNKQDGIFGEAADIAKQYELGTGEFENDSDIMFRDGDPETHEKVLVRDKYDRRIKTGWYQSKEALQDSMLSLKEAMKDIAGLEIEDIDGFENAYLGENHLSSVNKAEADAFARILFKPMLDEVAKLSPTAAERQELVDYMMAKHGLERNIKMAEREAKETGKSLAECRKRDYAGLTALTGFDNTQDAETEAQRMVDEYESNHDTTDLWNKVNAVSIAILSKSYECGLMDKDTFDNISNMYEFYIPLRGFDEKTSADAYAYLSHKHTAFNAPIKKAEGRSSKADDPFANLQSMAESTIMQGNRNRLVKQRFLNFTLNNPSDLVSVSDLWLEYDKINDEWKPVFPDNINTDDSGETVEQKIKDFEEKMELLAQNEPDRYKKGRNAIGIPYRVVENKDLQQHQVIVKRNGRDVILTINGNPRLAQALNGQTNPDNDMSGAIGAILRSGEWVNRQLSAFYTTRNPDFVVSNFLRDMLYSNSMAWIKESPNYALRFHRNYMMANPFKMKRLLSKYRNENLDMNDNVEKMFYQFMMNGGETGYVNIRDIEQHKNDIRKELRKSNGRLKISRALSLLAERFDELNRAIENCARFAAFMTSKEMGRTTDRAIYDAKEISVNFNKKGSGAKFYDSVGQTTIGNASALVSGLGRSSYVFWNAAIQGTTNFGRQVKRHPAKAFTGIATMFILGALMAYLGMDDDEEDNENSYYNLPEYVRRSNILFRAGEHWISIPLPVEYRAIYGLGELMTSTISGKEHLTDSEIAEAIIGQMSQVLPLDFMEGGGGLNAVIPSAAKPLWEAYVAEKSWTGLPLYKDTPYNKNMPEWTKAYKSANKHIVGLAEVLNEATGGDRYTKGNIDINPAKIEYVLKGYFGGIYNTIDKMSKMAETAVGGREYDPQNFLLLNRVVKAGDERTEYRAVNNEYFRLKEEHDNLRSRIKNYEKDTYNGIFDYAEKIDFIYNSPEFQRHEIFEIYKKDIKFAEEWVKQASSVHDDEGVKEAEHYLNELKKEMIEEMNKTRKRKRA